MPSISTQQTIAAPCSLTMARIRGGPAIPQLRCLTSGKPTEEHQAYQYAWVPS